MCIKGNKNYPAITNDNFISTRNVYRSTIYNAFTSAGSVDVSFIDKKIRNNITAMVADQLTPYELKVDFITSGVGLLQLNWPHFHYKIYGSLDSNIEPEKDVELGLRMSQCQLNPMSDDFAANSKKELELTIGSPCKSIFLDNQVLSVQMLICFVCFVLFCFVQIK